MLMEIFMKENGLMIRLLEKEFIITYKGQNIMGNGKMINKMEKGQKSGLTVQNMKVNIKMAKKKDKVYYILQMDQDMKVNLSLMIFMAQEITYGQVIFDKYKFI